MRILIPFLCLLLGACSPEGEQASFPPSDSEAERKLDDPREPGHNLDSDIEAQFDRVFGHLQAHGSPGASVMVIENGRAVFSKGYGFTDISGQTPLTRGTPFRLASVSKQMTAMAILILKERGNFSLDDPVATYVPEIGRFGNNITIRHLLTHTSGLPDYYDVLAERMATEPSVDDDTLFTNVDAAATYLSWGEMLANPGEKYEYSNPGYELLALIVERISGQSFGVFLSKNIFLPSGMKTAVLRDRPSIIIPDRAIGYRESEGDHGWLEDDNSPMNWLVGAGCIYASLDDLNAWDTALSNNKLVSQETLAEAHMPMVLNDGSLSLYGFGWSISDDPDRDCVEHSGGWVGFRTYMKRCTIPNRTVIILSNSSFESGEQSGLVEAILN